MIYIVYRYKIEPKKSSIGCFPLLVRIERLLLLMSINIAKLITTITRTSTIGIMIGANDLEKKRKKKKKPSVINLILKNRNVFQKHLISLL